MKPLHDFDAEEADRWMMRARRSLAGYAAELRLAGGSDHARAVIESHLTLLREFSDVHPARRAEIEALIAHYQPPSQP
jgi:hypothetical protein